MFTKLVTRHSPLITIFCLLLALPLLALLARASTITFTNLAPDSNDGILTNTLKQTASLAALANGVGVTNALQPLNYATDSVTVSNAQTNPLYATLTGQNQVGVTNWHGVTNTVASPLWTTNIITNTIATPLWTTNVVTNQIGGALWVTNVMTNTVANPLYMTATPMIVTNLSWVYAAGAITNTNGAALTGTLQFNNYEASAQYQIVGATWTGNANMAGSNQMIVVRVFNATPSVSHVFGAVPAYTAADALKYCGEIIITNITRFGTSNSVGTVSGLNIGVKPGANSIFAGVTCWTNFFASPQPVNTTGTALWQNNQGGQDSLQLVVERKR